MDKELSRRAMLTAVLGTVTVGAGAGTTAATQTSGTDSWLQLGRDGAKTGHNPTASGPLPGSGEEITEQWVYEAESAVDTQPIVLGDIVYFTVGTTLHGVDVQNGDQRFTFESAAQLFGPPVGAESGSLTDELYVATAEDEILAVSTATGNELWRYSMGGKSIQNPVSEANGQLYVGTLSSLSTIDTESQTQSWAAPVGALSPIAVSGERVWGSNVESVVGLSQQWSDQQRRQRGLEQESKIDGRWLTENSQPGRRQVGQVMIHDGTVHVSGDGVIAFEADTGQRHWSFDEEIAVAASPSADTEQVYFGSGTAVENPTESQVANAGTVYAMNADPVESQREALREELRQKRIELRQLTDSEDSGSEDEIEALLAEIESLQQALEETIRVDESAAEWTFETGGPINTKPAIAGETVFVASEDGFVYAIDTATGMERWRYEVGADDQASLTNPVVVGDRLYVGTERGMVALGVSSEAETQETEGDTAERTGEDTTDSEESGSSETDGEDDEPSADSSSGDKGQNSSDGTGPGFGLPAGLAALGGAGYLLGSRDFGEDVQKREQQYDSDE